MKKQARVEIDEDDDDDFMQPPTTKANNSFQPLNQPMKLPPIGKLQPPTKAMQMSQNGQFDFDPINPFGNAPPTPSGPPQSSMN